ncbi:hypothetical protein ACFY72_20880 [Streptomyces globisporus]|uniref:hypothetical protein n=1 Tax=Streptomyces globisporus TaxID=1908 RepID=UPI0036741732
MSRITIPREVAAHVLWHEGQGGHPAGTFTTKLLSAWASADHVNAARLSAGWPEYGAALDLLRQPGGVEFLRKFAGEASRG